MSVIDASTYFQGASSGKDPEGIGRLLVRCIVDAEGNRVYTDDETALIGSKPMKLIAPLVEIAMRESGLSDEEGLRKN